jgi:hypothetical protein
MNLQKHLEINSTMFKGLKKILIIRNDAVIMATWPNKESDDLNIAALVTGSWTASKSMAPYVDNSNNLTNVKYKLDFSTSSTGFFVQEINQKISNYFIVCTYNNCVNPAKIKNNIKKYVQMLERESFKALTYEKTLSENGPVLFSNITDEEIDNLFKQVTV